MRLYELQPFKKHPAFQAAKKFAGGNVTRDSLDRQMGKLGWNPAGQGFYASVYSNPKYPYVIKVFTEDNREYIRFMRWVMTHPGNPFVPELYGRLWRISSSAWAIRMEILEPIENATIYEKYVDPRVRKEMERLYGPDYQLYWKEVLSDENRKFLRKKWPQLAQVADYLSQVSGSWDLWGTLTGNIMRRGDTIVFTDPVS